MGIRGLPPGYMVGEHGPKRRYDSEFAECPECGGRMHRTAQFCQVCHARQKRTVGVDKERRERFALALAAGWTLEDIFGFNPDEEYVPGRDKLPTMEEIAARAIE